MITKVNFLTKVVESTWGISWAWLCVSVRAYPGVSGGVILCPRNMLFRDNAAVHVVQCLVSFDADRHTQVKYSVHVRLEL